MNKFSQALISSRCQCTTDNISLHENLVNVLLFYLF